MYYSQEFRSRLILPIYQDTLKAHILAQVARAHFGFIDLLSLTLLIYSWSLRSSRSMNESPCSKAKEFSYLEKDSPCLGLNLIIINNHQLNQIFINDLIF